MANKLHELLALEQDRKNKGNQAIGETKKLFEKKAPHFDGMTKRYIPMEENSEQIPDERKEIVTTVKTSLEEAIEIISKGIDAHLSKEETNASGVAQAELIVGDTKFGSFSATSLLALESHLNKLKDLYTQIPVLETTKKWHLDTQQGIYKTEEEVKFRSVKRPKVIVKYEATKEHPAQTELLYLDFQVGKYETIYTSGRIPLAQKNEMVQRVNQLLEATKVARSKANNVDVKNIKLAKKVFNFIHKDIL
ncbi:MULTISPECIES: hypothetical protein [unclassified Aureispira]|uniref:DUF7873 family protein n=1 Tax=unclassified Aureispira TaxID=2649989 RepID=UPI000696CBE2|nr:MULTISPECIES: hypothetical protein [unclassified Aureispira]WMX16279.1 hypothetical protein QP953_07865 [Aureispira sp. CCB-E]